MADSKNDSKRTYTTEESSKAHTTEDTGQSVDGERLHRPQSFQKLPSPPESDTGQQESGGSTDKTDTTPNDSSTSKSDSTSNDSSTDTDKK